MDMHHHSESRRSRLRSATAAVELALVAPLVAGLLVGLLEIGRIVQINQIVCNAAREGAGTASTGINTYSDVQTVVQNYLTNAGITNQSGLSVSVYNSTQGVTWNSNTTASSTNWVDQLQVTVTLPLNNVRLASLHFLSTDPNTVITGQAIWFSNQDQNYPTNIVPPSGS